MRCLGTRDARCGFRTVTLKEPPPAAPRSRSEAHTRPTRPTQPAVRRLVEQLRTRLECNETVLSHRAGGLGRGSTIAGCLLIELGMSVDQALHALRVRHRSKCPQNAAQRLLIRRTPRHAPYGEEGR